MDEEPVRSYGGSAALAGASAAVGLANWVLFVLTERGRLGGVGSDASGLMLATFLGGLLLLCVGTSLAAMAMAPRGAWPLGAAALLVNLSLPARMVVGAAVWEMVLWSSALAAVAALVMVVVYHRRRGAVGEEAVRRRRVLVCAWSVLAVALVAAALAGLRGCLGE